MTSSRWLGRARKALQRPPGYVASRLWQEARRQARRPWGHVRPRLLTDSALLSLCGSPSIAALWTAQASTPFFLQAADRERWAASFRARFPDAVATIVDEAGRRARHEFDLLGSGPVTLGTPLPWHTDFKTGRTWPMSYAPDIDYNELDQPSDVKVPWELSRCQHFVRFGQAYWLTGDERHAEAFVAQASDWILQNPWTRGVNWACTMDVALRAVSWVWAFHFLAGSRACSDPEFQATLLRSLYLHGEFIANNLEFSDVNGNHYLSDGVGLVVLGVFFGQTVAGAQWRRAGQAIVVGEMSTQVWADGVDFEQSTAYHRLVLEAFQTSYLLLRRAGHAVPDAAWQRLARMYEFVAAYTKPDGRAPLIGDADDGRVQALGTQPLGDHRYLCSTGAAVFDRGDLKGAAERCWDETFWMLGPDGVARFDELPSQLAESRAFKESGFYIMRGGEAHVIVDCGDNGMRGRGGHGHNDVLGFELFLCGMNVFTDCGAYLYTASREWRNAFRSTAFHNVLEVDGEELNRFVHPDDLWRLHYDAVPVDVSWHAGAGSAVVAASHTGYSRLREPVQHRRELGLDWRQSLFALRDTLTGGGRHTLVWRFHLEPGLTATEVGGDWQLSGERGSVWMLPVSLPDDVRVSVAAGWVSASYGRRRPNQVLTFRVEATAPTALACLVAPDRLGRIARRDALTLLEHAE